MPATLTLFKHTYTEPGKPEGGREIGGCLGSEGHLEATAQIRLCFAQGGPSGHVALLACPLLYPESPREKSCQYSLRQPRGLVIQFSLGKDTGTCQGAWRSLTRSHRGTDPAPGSSLAEGGNSPECVSTVLGVSQLRGSYALGASDLVVAFSSSVKWRSDQ